MSFDYSGFLKLKKFVEDMREDTDLFLKHFLLKQALDAVGKTRENTPTVTSLLKNSWQVGNQTIALQGKVLKSGKNKGKLRYSVVDSAFAQNATIESVVRNGQRLEVVIFNNVEYAGFVEFGHLDRGRKKWIPGRFMCTLAIRDVEAKLPARFKREFQAWVQTLQRKR